MLTFAARATARHGSLCLWFTKLIIKQLGTKCDDHRDDVGTGWKTLAGLCWIDFLNLEALNPCFWGGLEPIRSTNHVFFLNLNDFDFRKELVLRIAHVIHFPGVFASIFHPGPSGRWNGPVILMIQRGLPLAVVPPAVRTCGLAMTKGTQTYPDCQIPWLVLNIFSAHPSFVYELYNILYRLLVERWTYLFFLIKTSTVPGFEKPVVELASQRLLLFARDGPFSQAWSGFRFNCNIDIHYDDTSPTWFNVILEDLPLLTISNHHCSEIAVKSL